MILLDTHALVWAVADSRRLSRAAASAIRRARGSDGVAISAISLWELAALISRGRIQAYATIDSTLAQLTEGVAIRPITPKIAVVATQFPDSYSHNPADRLIGATARCEALFLVTRNENMRGSPLLRTIW